MKEKIYTNSEWEIYYTDYTELCKQYKENRLDDNWDKHYNLLLKKKEDDIIGW